MLITDVHHDAGKFEVLGIHFSLPCWHFNNTKQNFVCSSHLHSTHLANSKEWKIRGIAQYITGKEIQRASLKVCTRHVLAVMTHLWKESCEHHWNLKSNYCKVKETWDKIRALLLNSYVTLSKVINLLQLCFLFCKIKILIMPASSNGYQT